MIIEMQEGLLLDGNQFPRVVTKYSGCKVKHDNPIYGYLKCLLIALYSPNTY